MPKYFTRRYKVAKRFVLRKIRSRNNRELILRLIWAVILFLVQAYIGSLLF